MADYSISGENVGSGEPFADQVRTFSGRYTALLGGLARIGTEVERDRTIERDPDIAPHKFIRGAKHVFVFPPQQAELEDKEDVRTGVIKGTAPYTLTKEAQTAAFDPALVEAQIEIRYDDANNLPVLSITAEKENSIAYIEREASEVVLAAFSRVESVRQK